MTEPLLTKAGRPDRRSRRRRDPSDRTFTQREREVAELIAQGMNNHDIAEHLGINHKTVGTHREHALKKLGMLDLRGRGDVFITRHALRMGWVTL